jgi:peroxiredoxin
MKTLLMLVVCIFALVTSAVHAVSPVELPQMNGQGGTYRMTDHPEGIFVVEAYFLGCPYCNENAPAVNSVASTFANDPRVQVLDVGVDKDPSAYATWIARHNPNHPVLKDSSRKLISQLGTSGYPSTYVVNCKGQVVESTEGAWGNKEKQAIISAVEKLQSTGCHAEE